MVTDSSKEIWIFLSHSNKDFEKVRFIRNYLEEHSCRPVMFYLKCLSNDDEIDNLIKREIDCRTRFIICDSENSKESKWVRSEVAYIKSQLRSYDIIDLGKDEEEIKKHLDKIIKNTQIYLSYSRNDTDLVRAVYSHIKKYDIRCYFDQECVADSVRSVQDQLHQAIDLAKDFGFVVFFASKRALASGWGRYELQYAVDRGAKMLILVLDEYAKMHYKERFPQAQDIPMDVLDREDLIDYGRQTVRVRDLTVANSKEEQVEIAVEKIVNMAFAPWTTYTMAENMLEGLDCEKDVEEANRLFGIAFRKSDALDGIGYPGGTLFVARCMANGYGTRKDLNAALCYYYDYICISGCTEKINKEIEEIYTELVKQNPETAENEYTEFLSNWVLVSRNKSNEKAKKWYLEGIEEARKRLGN